MKSSQLIAQLRSLSASMPICIQEGEQRYFVAQVYHEPPHTFIQGAMSEGKYPTVQVLLERLEKIDKTVPFDAEIVSGDDWNYQEIGTEVLDETLVIDLSEPVIDEEDEGDDDESF